MASICGEPTDARVEETADGAAFDPAVQMRKSRRAPSRGKVRVLITLTLATRTA